MNETNTKEKLKILETKHAGALRELEKVTEALFKTQDELKAAVEIIEEKKFTQQLAGWSIDRALETIKNSNTPAKEFVTAEHVIETAEKFANWVSQSSTPVIKSPHTEAVN